MSFKDLEKKTQKVENVKDTKTEAERKKDLSDTQGTPTPRKSALLDPSQDRSDDLFDNVPV